MHTCLLCSKHILGAPCTFDKVINGQYHDRKMQQSTQAPPCVYFRYSPNASSSCRIVLPVFSPQQRWLTAHTVSTVGRTSEGRSSSAMKANQSASAATPSSAPTPAPSATGPSLWSQRYNSVSELCLSGASLTRCSGHQELHHKGRYWHEECFRCAKCYKNLAKEPFSTKDERIMCGKCCSKDAAPRCHGCYKPILAGMMNYSIEKCFPLTLKISVIL